MDFSFFTADNKYGHKTIEKWLNQNHKGLYNNENYNNISFTKNNN
jgi:hypothetical protein